MSNDFMINIQYMIIFIDSCVQSQLKMKNAPFVIKNKKTEDFLSWKCWKYFSQQASFD